MTHWLLCPSLIAIISCAAFSASAQTLEPRGELNWRLGSERSMLMNEYWVPFYQDGAGAGTDKVLYGDFRLMGDDQENREFNLGLGYREMLPSLGGIAGGHVWLDRRRTKRGNVFYQATMGAEYLASDWDLRLNAYVPITGEKVTTRTGGPSDPFLAGTGIFYNTGDATTVTEEGQHGLDLELGYRVPFTDKVSDSTRIYGGVYHFESDNSENISGWRTRIASDITQDVQLGARFQRDDERGSQGFLEATIRFPFGNKKSFREEGLKSRLDESPERDIDIVTGAKSTTTPGRIENVVNAQTGTAQKVIYVDNNASPGGDGSLETPYNDLSSAGAALNDYNILYIARGDGTSAGMMTA